MSIIPLLHKAAVHWLQRVRLRGKPLDRAQTERIPLLRGLHRLTLSIILGSINKTCLKFKSKDVQCITGSRKARVCRCWSKVLVAARSDTLSQFHGDQLSCIVLFIAAAWHWAWTACKFESWDSDSDSDFLFASNDWLNWWNLKLSY